MCFSSITGDLIFERSVIYCIAKDISSAIQLFEWILREKPGICFKIRGDRNVISMSLNLHFTYKTVEM